MHAEVYMETVHRQCMGTELGGKSMVSGNRPVRRADQMVIRVDGLHPCEKEDLHWVETCGTNRTDL